MMAKPIRFVEIPRYSIMPIGFEWEENTRIVKGNSPIDKSEGTDLTDKETQDNLTIANYAERPDDQPNNNLLVMLGKGISSNDTNYVPRRELARPTFGTIDNGPQETRTGVIKATKQTYFVQALDTISETFHVKQYLGWEVGICQKKDGSKSFVFPMNLDLLNGLNRKVIGHDQNAQYTTYAEVSKGIVRLWSIPSRRTQNWRYEELLGKGNTPQEALAKVPKKVCWVFDCSELVSDNMPVAFDRQAKTKIEVSDF